MRREEMAGNYIKCEREMIDFCLDKLNKYNVREYYDDGSYKPTNADKLLDCYLKQMINDKLALVYTYLRYNVEPLVKSGYKVCLPDNNNNIILRLMGVIGEDEMFIEEYIARINNMENIEELLF